MSASGTATCHGCALVLGTCGIIILGPSGSGKSRLADLLIKRWDAKGRFARWVADDRVALHHHKMRTIARAAAPISGLVERRFVGIDPVQHEVAAAIDMIVELIPHEQQDRMPEPQSKQLAVETAALPLVLAPAGQCNLAADIIEAQYMRLFD